MGESTHFSCCLFACRLIFILLICWLFSKLTFSKYSDRRITYIIFTYTDKYTSFIGHLLLRYCALSSILLENNMKLNLIRMIKVDMSRRQNSNER